MKTFSLVFIMLFVSAPAQAMRLPVRCEVIFQSLFPKAVKAVDPNLLPRNVAVSLRQGAFQMFEAGPNQWVGTGLNPQGGGFQRGFGGIVSGAGSKQTLETLAGAELKNDTHVFKLGDGKDAISGKRADDAAKIFSNPIAVRGRIPEEKFGAPRDPRNVHEAQLPTGTKLSEQITEMGIFYRQLAEPRISSTYDTPDYVIWGSAYLEIYEELARQGMKIDPNSRGGRFTGKRECYLRIDAPSQIV